MRTDNYNIIDPNRVDWEKFCSEYNSMAKKILESEDSAESIDLQIILTHLVELADQVFLYKKIYRNMEKYVESINEAISDNGYNGEKFRISEKRFKEQFAYSSEKSKAENVVNVVYLANALARTLRCNMDTLEKNENVGLDRSSLNDLKNSFFTIKDEYLRKMIKLRNELGDNPTGENRFLMQFFYRKSDNGAFYIHIPGYLEPFEFQSLDINQNELIYSDSIPFLNYDVNIEPIRVSGDYENEKALFYFARCTRMGYNKIPEKYVDGVSAYYDTQAVYGDPRARYIVLLKEIEKIDREIYLINLQLEGPAVRQRKEKEEKLAKALEIKKIKEEQKTAIEKELGIK